MQQSTMLKLDVLPSQHVRKLSIRKCEWYEDVSKLNRFADAELAKFRECDKAQIRFKKTKHFENFERQTIEQFEASTKFFEHGRKFGSEAHIQLKRIEMQTIRNFWNIWKI